MRFACRRGLCCQCHALTLLLGFAAAQCCCHLLTQQQAWPVLQASKSGVVSSLWQCSRSAGRGAAGVRHLTLQQVGVVRCHSQPLVLPLIDGQAMLLIYHIYLQLDTPSWTLTNAWLKRVMFVNLLLTCCPCCVANWLVELEYARCLCCRCPRCSLQQQQKVQAQQFCSQIATNSSSHQCSGGSSCQGCSSSTGAACISLRIVAASAAGAELNLHLAPPTAHVG